MIIWYCGIMVLWDCGRSIDFCTRGWAGTSFLVPTRSPPPSLAPPSGVKTDRTTTLSIVGPQVVSQPYARCNTNFNSNYYVYVFSRQLIIWFRLGAYWLNFYWIHVSSLVFSRGVQMHDIGYCGEFSTVAAGMLNVNHQVNNSVFCDSLLIQMLSQE